MTGVIKKFWGINPQHNELWVYSILMLVIPVYVKAELGPTIFIFSMFLLVTLMKIFNLGEKE